MHYEQQYLEFKHKQRIQNNLARQKQSFNRSMSSNNTNNQSKRISSLKLMNRLDVYPNDVQINLESSIPILHQLGILRVLTSITQAKQKLKRNKLETSRLQWQAKFIYFLWQTIDAQQIQVRSIKEIIFILFKKRQQDILEGLNQMFGQSQSIDNLIEAWKILNHDNDNQKINYQFLQQNLNQSKEQGNYTKDTSKKLSSKYSTNLLNTQNFDRGGRYQLSTNKQKQLVDRLYKPNDIRKKQQMKHLRQKQKQNKQLQMCTFHPQIIKRGPSIGKENKSIKGYQKTINRLRVASQKNKNFKQLRQYTPIGQNYQKLREKSINAPKFLNRKKEENDMLFMIEFDLGKHKLKVKIRQHDTPQGLAKNICKIYSLKSTYQQQIKQIILQQLDKHYRQLQQQNKKEYR